jgi:hypothetical protein
MQQPLLTLEAIFFVTLCSILIFFVPFRRLAPLLGNIHTEMPLDESMKKKRAPLIIHQRVMAVSKLTPWKSECFVRASAIAMMLRRRGYGYTIYLGVARDEQQKMIAHAWIRCGARWLSGSGKRKQFTVVATFSRNSKIR